MCLCCVCCVSSKCCTFLTSILTGVEALLFACLNLTLMLGYTCKIEPPQQDHLVAGFEYIEQCWSWFFYDEKNCEQKQGPGYEPPPWIIDTPDYFSNSSVVNAVSPYSNYCYQLLYFFLHAFWLLSAFILIYGNSKRRWRYFLPWIVLAILITLLDTITGSFYLILMDDTHPGWQDGRAIFSMQFLYFRTFIIYILNIFAIIFIILGCISLYRKRKRMEKLVRKLNKSQKEIVVKKSIVTTAAKSTDTTIHTSQEEVPVLVQAQINVTEEYHPFPDPDSYSVELDSTPQYSIDSIRNTTPRRYRPFSYTNPNYRPADPHDVEGMKTHATGLPMKDKNFYTGEILTYQDSFEKIDRIPRANLKK